MSYGKIVFGKLEFNIYSVDLVGGEFRLKTVARAPRHKHIRALPTEGMIPYQIYGSDGSLIAVGMHPASLFDEPREIGWKLADIYMIFPIQILSLEYGR